MLWHPQGFHFKPFERDQSCPEGVLRATETTCQPSECLWKAKNSCFQFSAKQNTTLVMFGGSKSSQICGFRTRG